MDAGILSESVSKLPGVGKARLALLNRLGIFTVEDLISFFPRTYEDRTRLVAVNELVVGEPACFRAVVISLPRTNRIRGSLSLTKFKVADATAKLELVFFNSPYVSDRIQYGKEYIFYGTLQDGYRPQMTNPVFEDEENAGTVTSCILPIYPLTEGLKNTFLSALIQRVLPDCLPVLPEVLPGSVRDRYHLISASDAYRIIHAPKSLEQLCDARRRLVFEEFFLFSAGLALLRSEREQAVVPPWNNTDLSAFEASLPYTLTDAQNAVLQDMQADVAGGHPMNRLIQGDVGSGKTILAAAAAYMAYQNGKQAAFMAPTEILAEQHFKTLSRQLSPLGMEIALLTGSLSQSEKKWLKQRLADGKIDLIIGTHALLTQAVSLPRLGLVITDEQHRFGVRQRGLLAEKAAHPHMLFLSATPIPRTLSLILYGDMDVSVIGELPPGRKPVETYLVPESMRTRINAFIRKQVEDGHQVYIVCPAVEEAEGSDLKSAEQWSQTLQKAVFPDLRVGLLHGQMKGAEKDDIMRAFAAHDMDILVATTVIEVGVDVANATLIVIEDADRFGLSQLHQLRGRVGRSSVQSYCVLFSSTQSAETRERLKAFCQTNDGFRIAEKDLALRGPGDFFGNRQHGLPQFRVASLGADLQTLREAQEATRCLESDSLLSLPEYRPLAARIQELFSKSEPVIN